MSSPYKYLKIENLGKLRKITISNPKLKNALNLQAYEELTDGLNRAATDDSVSIVAITGDGDYYSSGNDIKHFLTVIDPEKELIRANIVLKSMIQSFYTFPKLLVCVVNGPCIGIACSTAALCDVIYAVDTAYFYTPFSLLGLCAEGCASYTFSRILGKSKANEMLLLNHKLTAAEALQFNFVAKVYTKSELDTVLWPKIREQSELSRESICVTKKLQSKFDQKSLETACDAELKELYKRFSTDDFIQAVVNFIQRKSKL
ncbi:enoyl-CoA delta isomerase 2-like [Sitodiplosis mosellana]|uniref:enoyl-CoA delta isomerase 2-like n=1 Tax=Sitodiplosis mosellana TaxID=263140 RepID=UPI002443E2B5|nr:enoyl-CoA delta isomerase 2-like [Sitodiplosis mosellana]